MGCLLRAGAVVAVLGACSFDEPRETVIDRTCRNMTASRPPAPDFESCRERLREMTPAEFRQAVRP